MEYFESDLLEEIDRLKDENADLNSQVERLSNLVIAADRQAFESNSLLERSQTVKEFGEIEFMRKKMTHIYQRNSRTLMSAEKKFLSTPTTELLEETTELRGLLKGIKKCISALECRADDTDLLEMRHD